MTNKYANLDYWEAAALAKAKLANLMSLIDPAYPVGGAPFDLPWTELQLADIALLLERINQSYPYTEDQLRIYRAMLEGGSAGAPAEDAAPAYKFFGLAPIRVEGHPEMWSRREVMPDPEAALPYEYCGETYWIEPEDE